MFGRNKVDLTTGMASDYPDMYITPPLSYCRKSIEDLRIKIEMLEDTLKGLIYHLGLEVTRERMPEYIPPVKFNKREEREEK